MGFLLQRSGFHAEKQSFYIEKVPGGNMENQRFDIENVQESYPKSQPASKPASQPVSQPPQTFAGPVCKGLPTPLIPCPSPPMT